ncbi:fucosyltransferase 8 [Artemisia annua]|uniref:Fucosyltransferase n=1 Tax=Artemisia annua TaxID=35608 RepID=A0A2U1LKD8_ARTAN|nr:fucosyltransferase 8 [Artemisia annua]
MVMMTRQKIKRVKWRLKDVAIVIPYRSLEGHQDGLHESSLKHNQKSCLSRYQSALYRKESPYKPSYYLSSRLRQYEALHKRCGPYTESYNRTIRKLESSELTSEPSDCNYFVHMPLDGLGNKILSLASAFLYALLTNRVLLVYDNGGGIADLFCEPFPDTTWLLPQDFPILKRFETLNNKSSESYGNILNRNSSSSSFVYVHLVFGYDTQNELFFCDQDQIFLQNVSWVIMRSHFYYIPSLFLIKSFEQELAALFPEKESVFHFLGRYLFFPTNPVWDLITRYYRAYLAKSDEKLGIQIRIFKPWYLKVIINTTFTYEALPETILACSLENNLLPEFSTNDSPITPREKGKSIAVIVTSLHSGSITKIRDVYWENSAVNGDLIVVSQPSSEGSQHTGKKMHDKKAWAEIYLLSLTDKLITSSFSTFGYVAQGLGGLKPWILHMSKNGTVPNPACSRAISMEPCFHFPPSNGCKTRSSRIDIGKVVPYVTHCEDMSSGLKLVDP